MSACWGLPRRTALTEAAAVLPPEVSSAARARRLVRDVLAGTGRDAWAPTAELAVSEVVTNAAVHAGTELSLRALVFEDEILVDVQDRSPRWPVAPGARDTTSIGGRGLDLVAAVSRSCGVVGTDDGKRVWFCVGDPADTSDGRGWSGAAVGAHNAPPLAGPPPA